MANIHVRDIDDHALDVLRHQAEACGRSLNAELKRVIEQAARAADADAARELADRISARLSGRPHPDSAVLVREERDR
jgi:plasmid stability protein